MTLGIFDRILGAALILDAVLSFMLVSDKKFLWQAGRAVRLVIGIYFLLN